MMSGGSNRANVLLGAMLAMFRAKTTDTQMCVSQKCHARFNLGGLPPVWKTKRQARINRGGK